MLHRSHLLPLTIPQREERFFSNAVTHVVTTRQIPSELTNTSPDDQASIKREDAHGRGTIAAALSQDQRKTTSLLDASLQRRVQTQGGHVVADADSRRGDARAADILTKARELGIKIWALEKLQRVLSTMLQADTGEQGATQDTRPTVSTRAVTKPAKADLEQLLRNEKINGPADRDMTVAAQDMCTFRGCYIYVHDMDERTKPVMVRDYNKPATKEQGKWPQFRLTGPGRCPFIEDPGHTKRLMEQERKAADDKAQQEIAATRRTRASAAMEENPRDLRRSPRKVSQTNDLAKPLDPPKVIPTKRPHDVSAAHASTEDVQMPPLFGSAQVSRRGMPRMVGGEPVASGLQHSNVTSAIRSQIVSSNISSTAPGLSRRIPDSKEVSALKRKVLERGASNNINSAQSVPSSFMNDMRGALNDDPQGPPPRAAKRKAQETLGVVLEGNENGQADAKRRKAAPKKKATEKEPKPGYCENCRDKFEDFDSVGLQQ
jgi:regulatory subunit for Cdc7p protein kinase